MTFRADKARVINLDQAYERARNLRAAEIHRRLARAARSLRRLFAPRSPRTGAARRPAALAAVALLGAAGIVAIAVGAATPGDHAAERVMKPERVSFVFTTTNLAPASPLAQPQDGRTEGQDRIVLAEYGLDLAAIETLREPDRLWRVVRDLVLTNRLTRPTQQRILRRVWAIEPAVAEPSWLNSEHH